jgi:hypothetical protein
MRKGGQNGVKMPIFYSNVYKTPYNGRKAGLIGKISFQTTNRRHILPFYTIFIDLLLQKMTFWVLKGVKIPIHYNNFYETPSNGTKPGNIGKTSFQPTNGVFL